MRVKLKTNKQLDRVLYKKDEVVTVDKDMGRFLINNGEATKVLSPFTKGRKHAT